LLFAWTVAPVTIDAPNQLVGVVRTIVPLVKTVGFPDCVVTTATTPGLTALVLLPSNGFVGTAFPSIKLVGVARTVLAPNSTTDAPVQPVHVAKTVSLVGHVGVTTVASVTTDASVHPVGVAKTVLPGKLVV
jgi:hypothetical protein